jgi:hypothetical protein
MTTQPNWPKDMRGMKKLTLSIGRMLIESTAQRNAAETKLRILIVGLSGCLPNIENRGSTRFLRGPNKGKLAHPPAKEVAKYIRWLMTRVQDDSRCNDHCKWMYFCERKIGHKGKHKESGLAW